MTILGLNGSNRIMKIRGPMTEEKLAEILWDRYNEEPKTYINVDISEVPLVEGIIMQWSDNYSDGHWKSKVITISKKNDNLNYRQVVSEYIEAPVGYEDTVGLFQVDNICDDNNGNKLGRKVIHYPSQTPDTWDKIPEEDKHFWLEDARAILEQM